MANFQCISHYCILYCGILVAPLFLCSTILSPYPLYNNRIFSFYRRQLKHGFKSTKDQTIDGKNSVLFYFHQPWVFPSPSPVSYSSVFTLLPHEHSSCLVLTFPSVSYWLLLSSWRVFLMPVLHVSNFVVSFCIPSLKTCLTGWI
jgi:hypothetical protein